MAFINNKTLDITGRLGNFSFYKPQGSDKTIARTRGGADKKKILKSPKFALTRLNNSEFGIAAQGACEIRWAMFQLRHLADYNFTPPLNALCRSIMKMDEKHPLGERWMYFSHYRHLLDGFNLNRRYPFNNLVKPPVSCTLNRDTSNATVQLPDLLPGINLSLPWQYPMYRIVLTMGTICDGLGYASHEVADRPFLIGQPVTTSWRIAAQAYKGETIQLQADIPKSLSEYETIVVSIGIEMGTLISDAVIERVKYAGSGKILMAG